MDDRRFDALTKSLADRPSRRRLLRAVVTGAAAWGAAALGVGSAAAQTDEVCAGGGRVDPACRGAGRLCRECANCCSGICGPKDATGRRRCACPSGAEACGDACVDPATAYRSDPANCGACGRRCSAPANARATCAGGTCGFACTSGYKLCSGACIPTAACCTAADCPAPAVGTCQGERTCANGTCGFAPAASGTVCRTARGRCDVTERCDGVSLACPPDQIHPAGFVCRAATGPCDVAEICDGTRISCPADQHQPDGTTCGDNQVCCGGACVPGTTCG
jgi:hypothetical protein